MAVMPSNVSYFQDQWSTVIWIGPKLIKLFFPAKHDLPKCKIDQQDYLLHIFLNEFFFFM